MCNIKVLKDQGQGRVTACNQVGQSIYRLSKGQSGHGEKDSQEVVIEKYAATYYVSPFIFSSLCPLTFALAQRLQLVTLKAHCI